MIILGHRGYSTKYPQNTLLAFKKAIEYGADGVELDVWKTADGKIVVSHDNNLKKTYGVDVNVKDSTYESLLQYRQEGERMPLLEEVYDALPETAIINVEIKDVEAVEGAYNIVKSHNALKRTIFSSFELKALKNLRRLSEDARIAILTAFGGNASFISLPYYFLRVRAEFLNPPILMKKYIGVKKTRWLIKFYRMFGVKIGFWTVNEEKEISGLEDLCEILITDEVERMLPYKEK